MNAPANGSDAMEQRIESRLTELRQEYSAGQRMLGELEAKRKELEQTMLRIGGAIQVLEEMQQGGSPAGGTESPGGQAAPEADIPRS